MKSCKVPVPHTNKENDAEGSTVTCVQWQLPIAHVGSIVASHPENSTLVFKKVRVQNSAQSSSDITRFCCGQSEQGQLSLLQEIMNLKKITYILLLLWHINHLNAELNPICYLLALLEPTIFSTLAG